jgi:DNA (cytosine-5)-methyltransferase 1
MPREKTTVFEPFCGAGGMGLGFQQFFNVVEACDIMPEAVATYGSNFRETRVRLQDVRNLSGVHGDFDGLAGIIGGPPCQGASKLNYGKVSAREQNELMFEAVRLVEEIRPAWFVFENVPTLPREVRQAAYWRAVGAGYATKQAYLNAADYGAAQTRERWIIVGVRRGSWSLPPTTRPGTVRAAFSSLGRNWGFTSHDPGTIERFKAVRGRGWVSITGGKFANACRLSWDEPSPTVVNVKKTQMLHPDEDRAISLAEAAALQGFPRSFSWKGSQGAVSQMIANAMPVPMARALAGSLA